MKFTALQSRRMDPSLSLPSWTVPDLSHQCLRLGARPRGGIMLTTALDFPKAGLGKSCSNQCSLCSRAQGVRSQLMGRRELELALPAECTRGRLTGWESTRVVVGSQGVCRPGWDLGRSPSDGEAPMCTEQTCGYHWGDWRFQAPGRCDLPVLGGGVVAEAGGCDVGLVHLPTSPVPLLGSCGVWGRLHLWNLEVLRGS